MREEVTQEDTQLLECLHDHHKVAVSGQNYAAKAVVLKDHSHGAQRE